MSDLRYGTEFGAALLQVPSQKLSLSREDGM